ncbi:hypothetical protein OG599_34885 (plasmid) [Streptomyces sp. NBC_01335]|uniref:hypothetical protein n=1 Tax=Streptomyces sp. NBC_01335 TaxID=2903828 RepID=UPI002E14417A|nr:hypothetical protein OG599_34885 [Streptomyces sp. NBC_01335]
MTRIEELLSRTLLVRDRTMPRDVVPVHEPLLFDNPPPPDPAPPNTAAEDLRALCEAVVHHTPAMAVADFVTDQVPQPASALVLACVLQLTDTDDGARFWWQYAAGADQPAAAYCLYLHHLARGDRTTADWWHRQTDDTHPDAPAPPTPHPTPTGQPHYDPHPSTPTFLRILRQLAKQTDRVRTAEVTELMAYVPTAVAAGYLREPDMDLPLPGHDFADKISTLLTTAPTPSADAPARPDPDPSNANHSRSGPAPRAGHLLPARTGTGRPRPSSAPPRCAAPRAGGGEADK